MHVQQTMDRALLTFLELKAQKDLMSPITPHNLTQGLRSSGRQAGGTRLRGVSCWCEATIPLTTDQDEDTSPKKTRDSGCGGRGLLLQDHGLAEIYEINKKTWPHGNAPKGLHDLIQLTTSRAGITGNIRSQILMRVTSGTRMMRHALCSSWFSQREVC